MPVEPFATLASAPDPLLDELALAMAGDLREVDADGALAKLDDLAAQLAPAADGAPAAEVEVLRELLARRHGFSGDREEYDHPDNSMLDLVLERRKGLPILLSTVYVEVARRAGIAVAGVGLPGHFVAATSGRLLLCCSIPSATAPSWSRASPWSCARRARTRRWCGCSTTWSAPIAAAPT